MTLRILGGARPTLTFFAAFLVSRKKNVRVNFHAHEGPGPGARVKMILRPQQTKSAPALPIDAALA